MKRQLLLVVLTLCAPLAARLFPSRDRAQVCGTQLVLDFVRNDGSHVFSPIAVEDGRPICAWVPERLYPAKKASKECL